MKLPDVNVLLYAANVDSPRLAPGWRPHSRTRAAWAVPGSYCWVLCAWERGEAFCPNRCRLKPPCVSSMCGCPSPARACFTHRSP